MKKIILNKNKNSCKHTPHTCIDCGSIKSNSNAKRCRSCYYKHSQGSGNPNYKGGWPKCIDCGKILHNRNAKRCKTCFMKYNRGKNHYNYNDNIHKNKCLDCSKPLKSDDSKRCASCHYKFACGKNSPVWKEDKSKCIDCGEVLINQSATRCWNCYTKFCLVPKNNQNYKHGKPRCIDCGKELSSYNAQRCMDCNMKFLYKNINRKKNKIEIYLERMLYNILPKEYRYVGQGNIWIERFNPDFINCNGQKKIIELYGDYWHNRPEMKDRDVRRINTYKKYGYKTLIIWEKDIKNKKTINRILNFNKK